MTLNVTVLTPTAIYQSADFRLTDPGPPQRPIEEPSPKSVYMSYHHEGLTWNGLATYTGLGRDSNQVDVSTHLSAWLGDDEQRTMSEVAEVIRLKGTAMLDSTRRADGSRFGHTFVLAGFRDGLPTAFVISNFQNCFGKTHPTTEQLTLDTFVLRSGSGSATVIVTGNKDAALPNEARNLRRLAERHPDDGGRIRRRIEALTRGAARRSKRTISENCVVFSVRADGSGVMQLDRDGEAASHSFATTGSVSHEAMGASPGWGSWGHSLPRPR